MRTGFRCQAPGARAGEILNYELRTAYTKMRFSWGVSGVPARLNRTMRIFFISAFTLYPLHFSPGALGLDHENTLHR